MANLGYLQVVRHCNHFCGFCSNPSTPYAHTFETMKVLVDDFVERGYFGVILTGGEPTLHEELPVIARYARDQGLHVRMITNGHKLADPRFAEELAEAVGSALEQSRGAILQNHGLMAVGKDLRKAATRAMMIEETAKISLYVKQFGGTVSLLPEEWHDRLAAASDFV